MKRHIIGLALFSFIISAAAISYSFFYIPNKTSGSTVKYETPLYVPFGRTHCKLRTKSHQIPLEIKQAVYNVRTKQVSWELTASQPTSAIALHFFIKDVNGTHYLNTIFSPEAAYEKDAIRMASSSRRLDNLEGYENTYVIPENISCDEFRDRNYQPEFDAAKATAVTINYGK